MDYTSQEKYIKLNFEVISTHLKTDYYITIISNDRLICLDRFSRNLYSVYTFI
jgi:hypothetical protein